MRISVRRIAATVAAFAMTVSGFIGLGSDADALSPGVSFGSVNQPTWQTNGVVYGMAAAQGKVFAGGSFTQLRPPAGGSGTAQTRVGLAVLDAATGAPASCQFTLSGGAARVRAIVASPDESTIYIAGDFTTVNGASRPRVAALDVASCSVKTAFNAGAISAEVFGLDVYANTLYLAGGFSTVRGATRQYFAAVNATTGALTDWTADGQSYSGAVVSKRGRAVQVSPDGQKVVLGGYFYYINGQFSHSIAIISSADSSSPGGQLIKTYPQGFIPGNPNATSPNDNAPSGTSATHALANGAGDGRFYIGNEGIGGGVFDGRAAFRWSDGEQVWRDTCLGATQDLIEDAGTIYSVNHQHDCSGINGFQDGRRVYLAAQSSQDMVHYGWKPDLNDGTGEGIGPRALVIATSGTDRYLWVGGEFTSVNGSAQQGLTRFTDESSAPSTPSFVGKALDDGTVSINFRTSTDNDDSHLTYRVFRGSTKIWEGEAVSLWWQRPQVTVIDDAVAPGSLNTYRVEVTDGVHTRTSGSVGVRAIAASDSYQAAVRADSPSLYWTSTVSGTSTTSNAGSWVVDSASTSTNPAARSGQGMMGLSTSAEGAYPGDTSGSLSFDGVDDYVWNDALAPSPGTYTIETWIKTTTNRGGKIVGFGNGRPRTGSNITTLSGNHDRTIYMLNNGRLRFGVWTGSATTLTSSQSYNDGQWHHIVATQGPAGMTLWVDGNRVGKNSNANAQDYYGVWHVGGDQLSGWPDAPSSYFFQGLIDETAIYDQALTGRQITAHAAAGGKEPVINQAPSDAYGAAVFDADPDLYWRLDDTGATAADSSYFGTAPGTYQPGVARSVPGALGFVEGAPNTGARFTGSQASTIATAASGSPSNPFTLQLWFNAAAGSSGKLAGFENTPTGNGNNYDKMLYLTNEGRLVFGVYTGSTQTVISPASYTDGRWHQVTATQDGSGMKLYVDGALVGTGSATTAETGTGYWRLGGGNLGGWPQQPSNTYFTGSIDEFAVYGKALSASTIQAQYLLVSPDDEAPSTPGGLQASYGSGAVQLTWQAATDNIAVAGYEVYRGTTPGITADDATRIAQLDAVLTYADDTAGTGMWFYKVAALDRQGNRSAASAAASVTVPDVTAPAKAQVSAVVEAVPDTPTEGDETPDVTLSWDAVADDVATTAYAVHASTSADFQVSDLNRLASVAASSADEYSHVVPNPSMGTWYYRVVAYDAAGNASISDPVAATVPDSVAPTVPGNVAAQVNEESVELSWEASSDNVAVTGYQVHRGDSEGFTPSAETLIAEQAETSYVDEPEAGTWHYKVLAVDAAGNVSAPSAAVSATIVVIPDTQAPTAPVVAATVDDNDVELTWVGTSTDNKAVVGYRVYRSSSEDFTPGASTLIAEIDEETYRDGGLEPGTYYYKVTARDAAGNVSDASAAASASIAAAPVDPVTVAVPITEDTSVVSTAAGTNYGANNQLFSRGGTQPQQMLIRVPLPQAPSGTQLASASLRLRTSTDPSATSVDIHTVDLVGGAWEESTVTWNTRPTDTLGNVGSIPPVATTNTELSVTLNSQSLGQYLGQSVTLRVRGEGGDNLRILSSDSASTAGHPLVTLTFDGEGTAPDTTAPSAPEAVAAEVGEAGDVNLTWQASSDDVGVTGYEVHRGTAADFTPTGDTRLAAPSSRSYTDEAPGVGTWFYKVVAADAAGNRSEPSEPAEVTIEPVVVEPEPVEVQVGVEADAAVVSSQPATNYGSNAQLFSTGGTSVQQSFLRFELPEAPDGLALSTVSLRLRTSSDPSAGSAATHVVEVIDEAWDEATLTWQNRPTQAGEQACTIEGATAINTVYTVECDAQAFTPGESVTLRISSAGADNLRFFSRNHSTSLNYRPSLLLGFE